MTERLDALMTRTYQQNGENKTSYTKVGVAFPLDGGGFRLKLEALPVPTIYDNKVECSMLLVPPRERDQNARSDGPPGDSKYDPAPQAGGGWKPTDEDIPFACEWRV